MDRIKSIALASPKEKQKIASKVFPTALPDPSSCFESRSPMISKISHTPNFDLIANPHSRKTYFTSCFTHINCYAILNLSL